MPDNQRTLSAYGGGAPFVGTFTPHMLPGGLWWVDPRENRTSVYGARFTASQSRHLRLAHHADLNFGTGAPRNAHQFTCYFKRSWLYRAAAGSPSDRGYVGKAAGNNGWQVTAGDGSNGANSIKVFISTGSTIFGATTPQGTLQPDLSDVVVRYNGGGNNQSTGVAGGENDRLVVLIDGVSQVLTFTGSVPTQVGDATSAALEVGRNPLIPATYSDLALRNLFIWNRALTLAQCATLRTTLGGNWNQSGFAAAGLLTDLVAAWQMDEVAGANRVSEYNDLTSGILHELTESGGVIDRAESVLKIVELFRGFEFLSDYGTAFLYDASSSLGPALRGFGVHYAIAETGDLRTAAGDIAYNIRHVDFQASATAAVCLYEHNNAEAKNFFYPSFLGTPGGRMHKRVWDDTPGTDNPNGSVESGKTDFAVATDYTLNWRGFGDPGGSPRFEFRWNKTDTTESISANMENAGWTDDIHAQNRVALGAFVTGTVVQGRVNGFLGDNVGSGGAIGYIDTPTNRLLEDYLTTRRGG